LTRGEVGLQAEEVVGTFDETGDAAVRDTDVGEVGLGIFGFEVSRKKDFSSFRSSSLSSRVTAGFPSSK